MKARPGSRRPSRPRIAIALNTDVDVTPDHLRLHPRMLVFSEGALTVKLEEEHDDVAFERPATRWWIDAAVDGLKPNGLTDLIDCMECPLEIVEQLGTALLQLAAAARALPVREFPIDGGINGGIAAGYRAGSGAKSRRRKAKA